MTAFSNSENPDEINSKNIQLGLKPFMVIFANSENQYENGTKHSILSRFAMFAKTNSISEKKYKII